MQFPFICIRFLINWSDQRQKVFLKQYDYNNFGSDYKWQVLHRVGHLQNYILSYNINPCHASVDNSASDIVRKVNLY